MKKLSLIILAAATVIPMMSSCSKQPEQDFTLEVSDPVIICQGIRPEDGLWGPYQFPRPYNLGDRIVVSVHVSDDDFTTYANPYRWFESRDKGTTWKEVSPAVEDSCGVLLPNGERVHLPMVNSQRLKGWTFDGFRLLTPDYDFSIPAEEGHFPIPDGCRTDIECGNSAYAYRASRLAPSLREAKWLVKRLVPGEDSVKIEHADVDWPALTRVVHCRNGYEDPVLKALFPRGNAHVRENGEIWVTAFSGEGHINPKNGQYSPYYSAELFVSDDNGHSFKQKAHMEYPADGDKYPYKSGGFSDSDIAFMPDGSIVWFMRSNWYPTTGYEWNPMYWSRSVDNGETWSDPEVFSFCGTLPRLATLDCGNTIVVYGRPGIFINASIDKGGKYWTDPVEIITPEDRHGLANVVKERPNYHEFDGTGGNPEIITIGPDSALLVYSDFYVPDNEGVKRKSILCRTITVKKK